MLQTSTIYIQERTSLASLTRDNLSKLMNQNTKLDEKLKCHNTNCISLLTHTLQVKKESEITQNVKIPLVITSERSE